MDNVELSKQFNLISLAGSAKSLAYEAMDKADAGDFDAAAEDLKEADKLLGQTHDIQVSDIQKLVDGDDSGKINLIDVHAQDHLMSALEVRNLADVIIKIYRKLRSETNNG